MLLIFLNWTLIVYVSFVIGFGVRRMFTDEGGPVLALSVLWGFCIVSFLATFFMFFSKAGPFLLLSFVATAGTLHLLLATAVHRRVKHFIKTAVDKKVIIFGGVFLFCLLVLSSQPSKINDDGFYYTQTVMWFTQVGFVHGISNLLLPLGLASSWHVLQAVFSFDFLAGVRFNDLNGLLMFVFFVYVLENGSAQKDGLFLSLLFAGGLVLSVPFLSACSPDLPVIVLTVIAFHLCWTGVDDRSLQDILLLAVFTFTIKISAVGVVLLGILLFIVSLHRRLFRYYGILALVLVVGVTGLAKNIYQTGYPFFPFDWMGLSNLPWTTPHELISQYTSGLKSWGMTSETYFGTPENWENPGMIDTISVLLTWQGVKGWIYAIIFCSFPAIVVAGVVDLIERQKRGEVVLAPGLLHLVFIVNFFVWLAVAPQYRFILPVYLFYGVWFMYRIAPAILVERLNIGLLSTYTALIIVLVVSILPLSMKLSATSGEVGTTEGFSTEYLLRPHFAYKFPGLDSLEAGGQQYYHVRQNGYCWDSPLPCMSEGYYNLLKELGFEMKARRDGRKWRFVLRDDLH